MGNEMSPGSPRQPPGPLITSGRSDDRKPPDLLLASEKTSISKVALHKGQKPKDVVKMEDHMTHWTELPIVNIVKQNETKYRVEMEDGSEYIGGMKDSMFEGYGEIEWRTTKKRYCLQLLGIEVNG
jgi:hypothetical protein